MDFSPLVALLRGTTPSSLTRVSLARHDWCCRQGETTAAWWLGEGALDCFAGAVLADTLSPGELVVPDATGTAELGVRAVDTAWAWKVPAAMVRALAASSHPARLQLAERQLTLERRRRRRLASVASVAMTQRFPGSRGLYRPAPYTCDTARVWQLPCVLGDHAPLPPGARRVGDHALLVAVQYAQFAGPLDYGEMLLLVPVRIGTRVFLYLAWLFLDSPMAIFIGRELYGYPKMLGFPELRSDRLMLRTSSGTVVDARIRTLRRRQSSWQDSDRQRVSEALDVVGAGTLAAPLALGDGERSLHDAWRQLASVAARQASGAPSAAEPALAQLQQWLAVPVLGWQRTLQPHVKSPGEVFTRRWDKSDFVEDCLVATRLLPAALQWDSLRFFCCEDELLPPADSAVAPVHRVSLAPAWPGVGLHYTCRVTMELASPQTSRVLDYRAGGHLDGLDWGPRAWAEQGWFD